MLPPTSVCSDAPMRADDAARADDDAAHDADVASQRGSPGELERGGDECRIDGHCFHRRRRSGEARRLPPRQSCIRTSVHSCLTAKYSYASRSSSALRTASIASSSVAACARHSRQPLGRARLRTPH